MKKASLFSFIHFFSILGLLSLLLSCHDSIAGNTLETENSIAFSVKNTDGNRMAKCQVLVRPTWFVANANDSLIDSIFIRNLKTDEKGSIIIEDLPKGHYKIEVRADSLKASYEYTHLDTAKHQELQPIIVRSTGSIKGQIKLPAKIKKALVQIYGLDYYTETDENGFFEISNLPAGFHRIRSIQNEESPILAEDLTEVYSEKLIDVGLMSTPTIGAENPNNWMYTQTIRIDSLVPAWHYPLFDSTIVTLRLDSLSFDFTKAASNAQDLRFETSLGTPLAFKVRRWEPELKRGVIRIRVSRDLIENQESLQFRYGRPNAINRSIENEWEGIPDSTFKKLNSILVSDFENQTKTISYPEPIAESYWYQSGSTTASTAIKIEEAGEKREGYAIHFTYNYTASDDWGLIGSFWDGKKSLATLDSIVLWARGDGEISVSFDRLADSLSEKSWVHITINETWTKYKLTPDDLLPEDSNSENIGWHKIRDKITNLNFFGRKGTGFWLDDIVLYGIDREDLK